MVTVVKVIRATKMIFSLADKAGETSARKVILEEKLNTFFFFSMTEYAGLQRSDLTIEELLLRTKSPVL